MWYVQLLYLDLAYASCIVEAKVPNLPEQDPILGGSERRAMWVYGVEAEYSHGIRIDFGWIWVV